MLGRFAEIFVLIALSQTPTLSGVSPTSGTIDGGRVVTLSGTNFVLGATVTFGGVASPSVTVTSPTRITTTTPAGSAGAVDVTVTNPGGQFVTRPNFYTYTPLTISSISPNVGSFEGGAPFTVTLT